MDAGILQIIVTIITTAGTIFGGRAAWNYFTKKDDNQTSLESSSIQHEQEMQKTRFNADLQEGSRAEKLLKDQLKNMEERLQKHEERIEHLEMERQVDKGMISRLEKELELEKLHNIRLNKIIDTVEGMLTEKGVDAQIVSLIKSMR